MTKAAGYDPYRQRIAIMITINGRSDAFAIFEEISSSGLLAMEDIPVFTESQEILIFKSLSCPPARLFSDYKEEIQTFVVALRRYLKMLQTSIHGVVGSAQNSMENYFYAYQHCQWMARTKHNTPYFYDYVHEYIFDAMPHTILSGVFGITDSIMDEPTKEMFMPLMDALKATNYNLNAASSMLYIHKNTLVFRYNKIKNLFGIQPLQNSNDKGFAEVLYYYLLREGKQKKGLKRPPTKEAAGEK